MEKSRKPHAVIIPFPHQGHINPMLKIAKLLHGKGFHITFVNSELWHKRLVDSNSHGRRGFNFKVIPSTDFDVLNCNIALPDLKAKIFLPPVHGLVKKLIDQSGAFHQDDDDVVPPPVTCMVSDTMMLCSFDVAKEFGIPLLLLYVAAASSLLTFPHIPRLLKNGVLPLKDEKAYIDTVIEGISGINGTIRVKDLPTVFQFKDPNYLPYRFFMEMLEKSRDKDLSIGLIFNTFGELEPEALQELSSIFQQELFSIGPLHQLFDEIPNTELDSSIEFNLVQDVDLGCLAWLDSKPPDSVILVSFGTTGLLKPEQLEEFAWGLAESQESFLWVIRSNLIWDENGNNNNNNNSPTAPWSPEFELAIKERGLIISWCPQKRVLRHPAIGGYLTHCGWNSLLESITAGVPLLCWPSVADQPTNSWICCNRWGNGKEIGKDVKREEIVRLVRELIRGEGNVNEMKKKAMEWKKKAEEACRGPNGSSFRNLQKMVDLLLSFGR